MTIASQLHQKAQYTPNELLALFVDAEKNPTTADALAKAIMTQDEKKRSGFVMMLQYAPDQFAAQNKRVCWQ